MLTKLFFLHLGLRKIIVGFAPTRLDETAKHIYFGECKGHWLIHRTLIKSDYYEFQRHEGELQPSIRTKLQFMRLASPFGVAALWMQHCRARVAQGIRDGPPNVAHTFLRVATAVYILCKKQICIWVSPVTRFNWSSHDTGWRRPCISSQRVR